MDTAIGLEQQAATVRGHELRSRAARLRREAMTEQRRAEETCARLASVLVAFDHRPFGDRGDRFLLSVGRSRPLLRFVRHDLRRWLERAGLPDEPVSDVTLACSEACANAVEHAQRARRQLVEIEAALRGGELELRVRDFGNWDEEQPASLLRGRGLDMIRDLMDSFEVQRSDLGTEIVMRRSLTP